MCPRRPRALQAALLALPLTLAACGAPSGAPATPPAPLPLPPAAAAAVLPSPVASRAIELSGPLHPESHSVAPSPEAFHTLFAAQLAGTAPEVPGGLVTRYDALAWHGATWVLAEAFSRLRPTEDLALAGDPAPCVAPRLDAGTRPWPAADWDALVAGAPVVARQGTGGLQLIGLIHAAPACLVCHDWQDGLLIGAYEYHFVELADD